MECKEGQNRRMIKMCLSGTYAEIPSISHTHTLPQRELMTEEVD